MGGFNWTIAYNANDIVLDAGSAVVSPQKRAVGYILTLLSIGEGTTAKI
jgi:hypothetical protein